MSAPEGAGRAGPRHAAARRRVLVVAAGVALVAVAFVWFLPTLAGYGDVRDVLRDISWKWLLALLVAVVASIATYAPPWMVALPGLRFLQALQVALASTALAMVAPGGGAAGLGASFATLRSSGFERRSVGRAVAVVAVWNPLLTLLYPAIGLFLLTAGGDETALLATVALVAAGALGAAVTGLTLVLSNDRLARDLGDLAARLASWVNVRVLRRGPVSWNGGSFERFRDEAGELVRARGVRLTVACAAGHLSVFAVLLVALRAVGVPASDVSAAEAFAAWSLVRLLASVPITPAGVGVVEVGLTSALIGFGGDNAQVVTSVLVYRALTVVPTLALGLVAGATSRRHSDGSHGTQPAGGASGALGR